MWDEYELLEDARRTSEFPENCQEPRGIECRTVDTHKFSNETADAAVCDVNTGLTCKPKGNFEVCLDYEVRYYCCEMICPTTLPPESTTPVQTTTIETTSKGN